VSEWAIERITSFVCVWREGPIQASIEEVEQRWQQGSDTITVIVAKLHQKVKKSQHLMMHTEQCYMAGCRDT